MARYFFHLFNDVDTIDEDGTDCLNDTAAIARARAEAVAMAAASITAHRHLVLSHSVQVLDEAGRNVATVRFGDVVTVRD
ncbi:DUF6894 family protein [Sphingomonas sp. OTU376]|jgi:hypothetical protein|uniref:DUF6894 family protein n=1 Tax=Sphingomonas sp. OTU376 TaxID=3043863 RepID=UPI00313AD48B